MWFLRKYILLIFNKVCTFAEMLKNKLNIRLILTLVFCASVGIAFASFNFDHRDKDKNRDNTEKFSLKNIQRPASFFSLSTNLLDVGASGLAPLNKFDLNTYNTVDDNGVSVNSSIRVKTGNTVVIYPYKYKLKPTPLSLFKTPTAR